MGIQRLAQLVILSVLAGCALTKPAARYPAQTATPPSPTVSAEPEPKNDVKPIATPPAAETQAPTAAGVSNTKPINPKNSARPSVSAAPPKTSAPAKVAAPVAQAPKATLDFKTLVERLRNTSSIGVFTKLSVKNQVDDLLGDFRGYYAGKAPPTLDDLHERYDGLVLKVVALVQKGDASLASAISGSRSAIWERLSNRESFQAI